MPLGPPSAFSSRHFCKEGGMVGGRFFIAFGLPDRQLWQDQACLSGGRGQKSHTRLRGSRSKSFLDWSDFKH